MSDTNYPQGAPTSAPPTTPPPTYAPQQQPPQQQPKKSNNKTLWIIVQVLVVALIIGGWFVYRAYNNKKHSESMTAVAGKLEQERKQRAEAEAAASTSTTTTTAPKTTADGRPLGFHRYTGSMRGVRGQIKAELNFDDNGFVEGNYYYTSQGSANRLRLSGFYSEYDGCYTLSEEVKGSVTGTWEIYPNSDGSSITGRMYNYKYDEYSLSLTEDP